MSADPYVVGSNRKIDPNRRRISNSDLLPDGTPNNSDRVEIGPTDLAFEEWQKLGLTVPDIPLLRNYRLSRLVGEIQQRDLGGLLMFDPLNIRYATDSTNMQLWVTHNPCRACLVTADGYMVLWDFHAGEHLSAHLPLVREVRHGASFFYFETGDRSSEIAESFASQVDELMRERSGNNRRLAVDKIEIDGLRSLEKLGFEISPGQEVTEHARKIKNANELSAMRCAIASCEAAMADMRRAAVPGKTEVDAWAELQKGNFIRGGEWIETRLLTSGPRTNPWFQECGPRVISEGEILAFDTDLIGPYGICADLSRTWWIGDDLAPAHMRESYAEAVEHIRYNTSLLRPGLNMEDLTRSLHVLQDKYDALKYSSPMHGVGMCDEWPLIAYPDRLVDGAFDAILEPSLTLCVEALVGEIGGDHMVKLEDQGVITDDGFETMSVYPWDERLFPSS